MIKFNKTKPYEKEDPHQQIHIRICMSITYDYLILKMR